MTQEIFDEVEVNPLSAFAVEGAIATFFILQGERPPNVLYRRFFLEEDGSLLVEIRLDPSQPPIVKAHINTGLWRRHLSS